MKVSYPVKVAVKKTAFIALFSGMVLSAGAQNTNLITEEEPDIKVTKDTVWNMAIEKKATPKVQFPQPGDTIDVLDPIVYSLCYTTAYDRLARKSVKVKTYRKEYAPYIHAGYDFGVKHWKEIVLKTSPRSGNNCRASQRVSEWKGSASAPEPLWEHTQQIPIRNWIISTPQFPMC